MNPISPVHWSPQNGLHVDNMFQQGNQTFKLHEPVYPGQTTLNTFTNPSYANDRTMFQINNPGTPSPMLPYQR